MAKSKSVPMHRRRFLWLLSACSGSVALSQATGCAVNPATGERQLMLVDEQREIDIDKAHAPQQFSQDMGVTQDTKLNAYVSQVGMSVVQQSPRKHLPFNFQVVNANYINAYAFPAGSIAATRGIMLELNNEDELAALMGHEIAHVSARHSASRMSTGMLANVGMVALGVYAQVNNKDSTGLGLLLGSIGVGALLAHYSRANERQADSLGMKYADKASYSPQGMVGLMAMLQSQSKGKPNAVELMFATHPMSNERFMNVRGEATSSYSSAAKRKLKTESYNDNIAFLRSKAPSIEAQQQGEAHLARKDLGAAMASYRQALAYTPEDYPALIGASRLQMVAGNAAEGERYAQAATSVYPREAQGHNLLALASLELGRPNQALTALSNYDTILPGNPNTQFLRGISYEQMGDTSQAQASFRQYLESVPQSNGDQAQYARSRLN